MPSLRLSGLGCALALVYAPGLFAAEATKAEKTEARRVYSEGEADYQLGNFTDALKKYEQAYKLARVPALLFNIAQCHRQLKHFEQAAVTYRSFIRLAPQSKQVALARKLLKQVESQLKSEQQTKDMQPLGTADARMPAEPAGEEKAAQLDPIAPLDLEPTAPATAPEEPAKKEEVAAKAEEPKKALPPTPPAPEEKPAAEEKKPAVVAMAPPPPKPEPQAEPPPPAKEDAPSRAAPAPAVEAPPVPPGERGRVFTWVAAGGAGLALAAGTLFGMQAKSTNSSITGSQHERAELDKLKADLKSQAGKANLAFAAGAGLAVLTATLFILKY